MSDYNQENKNPNHKRINNNKNIQIIGNSRSSEEEKDYNSYSNTRIININQSSNETGTNNDETENRDESNNEENEDNSEETELEREAAILLNKQYEQIKKLKEELCIKNNEINNLNQIIGQMNCKMQEIQVNNENDNNQLFNNLKNQIDVLNEEKRQLNIDINNKEQLIFELKSDLNTLSKKFNDLNQNLHCLSDNENNEKINQLISLTKKYSNEIKSNEDKINLYEDKINLYEKEINKLNQNLKNEIRLKQKIELLYNDKIKEEKKWISQVNQDINMISQWVSNYIGVYFDKNIEIPEIPYISPPISSENILVYNKFDFGKLRRDIYEARKKVWEKQTEYESNIEKLRKEQIDFIDKINKLNKDITALNNENLSLKEELNKRNINLDILQGQLNKYSL